MFALDSENNFPSSVKETATWLQEILGRPALPECPIEAATEGREPKAPHYIDGRAIKSVQWKTWQTTMPQQYTLNKWFADSRMGIGTLGGFNGKHWLCWIDFDQKTFANPEACDKTVSSWEQTYWFYLEFAPVFRTPSGGYRYLVAFESEPVGWGANNGFSLSTDGSKHAGELLTQQGGHTLLPPTKGLNGKCYEWVRWFEYPPVVSCPEDLGLYLYKKPQPEGFKENNTKQQPNNRIPLNLDGSALDFIYQEIYPRLPLEQAFSWNGHNFKEHNGGAKLKGNCPWHDSNSGTAFYCSVVNGVPMYRCPVDGGGTVIQYRYRLKNGGTGTPRGKEFIEIAKELAAEVGVLDKFPSFENKDNSKPKTENNTAIPDSKYKDIVKEQILKLIQELADKELSQKEVQAQLIEMNKAYGYALSGLSKVYEQCYQEKLLSEGREDNRNEIGNILNAQNASFVISKAIPKGLAKPMEDLAYELGIRPASFLTALLAGLGSVQRTATFLTLIPRTGLKAYPNIFAAIVGEVSAKKTPAFTKMVIDPVALVEKEYKQTFNEAIQTYNQEMQRYKSNPEEFPDGEPIKPVQRVFVFTKTTGEGITSQANKLPENIMAWATDELAGLFQSDNAYRSGKGSDAQDRLSYYNGSRDLVLRADGIRADVDKILLSIIGTIQPNVLGKLIGDCSDVDGRWSRFLFVIQPKNEANISTASGSLDLNPMLASLYRNIDNNPAMEYELNSNAQRYFLDEFKFWDKKAVEESHPGLSGLYGKIPVAIGKIALNLHCIKYAFNGEPTPKYVELETIKAAAELAKFYVNQAIQIYAQFSSDTMPYNLACVIKAFKKRPDQTIWTAGALSETGCIPKQVQLNGKPVKRSAELVWSWLRELEKMGYGKIEGIDRSRKFIITEFNSIGFIGSHWATNPMAESIANTGTSAHKIDSIGLLDKLAPPPDLDVIQSSDVIHQVNVVNCSGVVQMPEIKNSLDLSNNPMEVVKQGSNVDEEQDTAIGLNDQQNPMEPTEPSQLPSNISEPLVYPEMPDPWLDTDIQPIYIDVPAGETKVTDTTADTTPESKFQPGAKVKVTVKGKFRGKVGDVVEVPSETRLMQPKKYRVSFIVGTEKSSAWFYESEIKEYDALPEPVDASPTQKVTVAKTDFDFMKYNDKDCTIMSGEHSGVPGTTQAYCREDDTFLVRISGGELVDIKFSDLRFDTVVPQQGGSLAKDDKVVITEPGHDREGHTGQVVLYDDVDDMYVIEFKNGASTMLKASSLKKIQT